MLSEAVLQYVKEDVVNVGGFERTEFVAADEGRFEMRAYPGSDCGNNIGTVHGAFLLALADMAGTGAVDTLGRENATLSLNANFLRPVRTDDAYLAVVGEVVRAGRTVAVSRVEMTRPDGKLAFTATCTVVMFDSSIEDVMACRRS